MVKPRTKKKLIVISTLALLVLSNKIYWFTNYDFNYLQKTNQTQKAQNLFWKYGVPRTSFGDIAGAYDKDYVQESEHVHFTLDLNSDFEAVYFNKAFDKGGGDKFFIEVHDRTDAEPKRNVGFEVSRKDFSIINEDQYGTKYMTAGMNAQEQRDLMNLAIKRFKEAQDKYYNTNK